jgi:hypothetical protein
MHPYYSRLTATGLAFCLACHCWHEAIYGLEPSPHVPHENHTQAPMQYRVASPSAVTTSTGW